MGKKIIFMFILILVASCFDYRTNMDETSAEGIDFSKQSIGIIVPKDGRSGEVVYNGSGETVAEKMSEYVSKRTSMVLLMDEVEGALESCSERGTKYLIVPSILRWKDSGFNLKGDRDEVKIKLEIYDTGTAEKVNNVVFMSISPWWTFANKKPADMLGDDFEKAVNKLLVIEKER